MERLSRIGAALLLAACQSNARPVSPKRTDVSPIASATSSSTEPSPEPDAAVRDGFVIEIPASGDVIVEGTAVSEAALVERLTAGKSDETVVLRVHADASYARWITVLDALKRAGRIEGGFVLASHESPTRRTATLRLPRAGEFPPPPPIDAPADYPIEPLVSVEIDRDGKRYVAGRPISGSVREAIRRASANGAHRVVLRADRDARFEVILDTIVDAQAEGARIAFAISLAAPDPPVSGVTASVAQPAGPTLSTRPTLRGSFPPCPFPAEADRAQIDSAVVMLKIQVDARGKTTKVSVLSDPGNGFANAAKQCAQKARFDAGRDTQGKPVASDVAMRVRFER